MALKPSQVAVTMRMPGSMLVTEVTLPSTNLCHYITDDELERIGEMRKEPIAEICLAAAGAFLGSIIPALNELSKFNDPKNPMGLVGLLTCLLAVTCLAIAAATGFLWNRRAGNHAGMISAIRARPRVPVQSE